MAKLAKTKKLNAIEKSCIKGLILDGHDAAKISTILEREIKDIEEYLNVLSSTRELESVPNEEDQKQKTNHFVNKTVGGKKGVVVMTQTASERSDVSRQNNQTNKNQESYIHKIRNE